MADLEGQWVPRTESDLEYLQRLYGLTGQAYQNGVEKDDIITGLMFVAAMLQSMDPEDLEAPEGPTATKIPDCPDCGEEIGDILFSLGGNAEVQPCGCVVPTEQVEGWIDYE